MGDTWDNLKKDWQAIKNKGFKPMSAAADEGAKVDATRTDAGKLAGDQQLSVMERAILAKKGANK